MTTNYQRTTKINPTWCPGCGNFGILGALKLALDQLNISPHQLAFVYDVGCSGNMADFTYGYGFHSLHGRALPVAAGIKLANPKIPVIAIIGDGGCFGEGLAHFISLSRGNHDIVVLSHDNYLYSLTTGQMSPTTKKGTVTPSTPNGSLEETFNPIANAIINHATFVARGFAGNIPDLATIIIAAIKHRGFSFVDILQPCITYNKDMPYDWYRNQIYQLGSTAYDPTNKILALQKSLETKQMATGIFYQTSKPTYHEQVLPSAPTTLAEADISNIKIF
ncbi:MAG: thiamine pyrophosphate-dependent enzyme [Patescibacteria group bacterium]|nr:thiamine pyrophosphate-dependent enzyme [Patescibacteria group bacterium]